MSSESQQPVFVTVPEAESPNASSKIIRPDVSYYRFAIFLWCCTLSIASLVFINATQTFVLIDILSYPRGLIGNASGSLAFADEILSLMLVSLWGLLSDRIGRGPVMAAGLGFMSLSIALYPWSSYVFPSTFGSFFKSMLFYRLIFAVGGSGTTAMITALIGDFAAPGTRAKVAAFTGTSAGFGALLAVLLFARLPILIPSSLAQLLQLENPKIYMTFGIMAFILLLTSLLASFGLTKAYQQTFERSSFWSRLRCSLAAAKNPLVSIAYFSGFVARADSIALNLFIGPWVDNYMTKTGRCPPIHDGILVRCEPAKRMTSNLMSVSHVATLIGAPFFGIFCDRLGPIHGVALPALMGFISFGALYSAKAPDSPIVYCFMFLSGLADIGMIISSMALISSQSSDSQRGALAGMYSLFGALGIIVTSKLGGYMFDHLWETAPFLIVSISSATLLFLIVLRILVHERK